MFSSTFGLRSRNEVKILFARLVLQQEIQVKKLTLTIGKITARLMKHFGKTMVEKDDFIMALILFYLSERKHDYDQIDEKLSALNIPGAQVIRDKELEKKSFQVHFNINSQKNLNQYAEALQSIQFNEYLGVLEGDIDV